MYLRYEKERLLIAGQVMSAIIGGSKYEESGSWTTEQWNSARRKCFEVSDYLIEEHYRHVKIAEQERKERLSKVIDEVVVDSSVGLRIDLAEGKPDFTDAYKQPIKLESSDED